MMLVCEKCGKTYSDKKIGRHPKRCGVFRQHRRDCPASTDGCPNRGVTERRSKKY